MWRSLQWSGGELNLHATHVFHSEQENIFLYVYQVFTLNVFSAVGDIISDKKDTP